jgi:hypothetical protein
VYKLVKLFQANEDSYTRLLWEEEEKWKESWKKYKLGEYKLDHLYREQKDKTKVGEASTSKITKKKQGKSKAKAKGRRRERGREKGSPRPKIKLP